MPPDIGGVEKVRAGEGKEFERRGEEAPVSDVDWKRREKALTTQESPRSGSSTGERQNLVFRATAGAALLSSVLKNPTWASNINPVAGLPACQRSHMRVRCRVRHFTRALVSPDSLGWRSPPKAARPSRSYSHRACT
ncbi:hypothetical protein BOTBODRAFT_31858, partial [Botryobasidium botryosum FD-172 SS1]